MIELSNCKLTDIELSLLLVLAFAILGNKSSSRQMLVAGINLFLFQIVDLT